MWTISFIIRTVLLISTLAFITFFLALEAIGCFVGHPLKWKYRMYYMSSMLLFYLILMY